MDIILVTYFHGKDIGTLGEGWWEEIRPKYKVNCSCRPFIYITIVYLWNCVKGFRRGTSTEQDTIPLATSTIIIQDSKNEQAPIQLHSSITSFIVTHKPPCHPSYIHSSMGMNGNNIYIRNLHVHTSSNESSARILLSIYAFRRRLGTSTIHEAGTRLAGPHELERRTGTFGKGEWAWTRLHCRRTVGLDRGAGLNIGGQRSHTSRRITHTCIEREKNKRIGKNVFVKPFVDETLRVEHTRAEHLL